MSEATGYEAVKCQVRISPDCKKNQAGYLRRPEYAQQGEWKDACEPCARTPYKQPAQFQDNSEAF